MTVFTITEADEAKITELRTRAEAQENVITHSQMVERVRQAQAGVPTGLFEQNITLEWGWDVTYSVEEHRPGVPCRHLSMSSPKSGMTPLPMAMDIICEKFGFKNRLVDEQNHPLDHPAVYFEALRHGGHAVNVIEPMSGRFEDLQVVEPVHETMQ